MGMPVRAGVTGTGSFVFTPDWMQTPFQVGIGVIFSGDTGTATVDVTFDPLNTTGVTPTWFSIIALGSVNATANYTTPVQGMRVNLVTASATSVVTVNFVQATFPR